MIDTSYKHRADIAEGECFKLISTYANSRLIDLAIQFRSKFPKRSLKIVFNNQTQIIAVDGQGMSVYGKGTANTDMTWNSGWADPRIKDQLGFIADAVRDVWDITDHYRRGCPDDLEVLPDDSELTGGPNGKRKQKSDSRDIGEDISANEEWPGYRCPRPGLPGDAVYIQ